MRMSVNRDLCESNAVCIGLLPERLALNDDEVLVVSPEPVSPDLVPAAEQAVLGCPRSALTLVVDTTP